MKNIILCIFILMTFSCQPNKQKSIEDNSVKNEIPIVGTWKFLGAIDSLGNEVEYFSGENTYLTALDNGIMIEFGFRKNFPDSISSPPTCEQLLEAYNESFGNIINYTFEGNILRYTFLQSTHPDNNGTSFEFEIEFIDDLFVGEFEGATFKYKRVE